MTTMICSNFYICESCYIFSWVPIVWWIVWLHFTKPSCEVNQVLRVLEFSLLMHNML